VRREFLYIKDKQKQLNLVEFLRDRMKQCKIGIANEKSHIVESHGVGLGTGNHIYNSVLKIKTPQTYFLRFDLNKNFKSS